MYRIKYNTQNYYREFMEQRIQNVWNITHNFHYICKIHINFQIQFRAKLNVNKKCCLIYAIIFLTLDIFERSTAYEQWLERRKYFEQNILQEAENFFVASTRLTIDVEYSFEATSSHVIGLMKVFMSLDEFVLTMLEKDRLKAIELFRQAVNYFPDISR